MFGFSLIDEDQIGINRELNYYQPFSLALFFSLRRIAILSTVDCFIYLDSDLKGSTQLTIKVSV